MNQFSQFVSYQWSQVQQGRNFLLPFQLTTQNVDRGVPLSALPKNQQAKVPVCSLVFT